MGTHHGHLRHTSGARTGTSGSPAGTHQAHVTAPSGVPEATEWPPIASLAAPEAHTWRTEWHLWVARIGVASVAGGFLGVLAGTGAAFIGVPHAYAWCAGGFAAGATFVHMLAS